MSRKHFIAIATIIAKIEDQNTRNQLANEFAVLCAKENINFNFDVFFKACGAK